MSGNTILKPGDTLTAAQANALPVGSEIAGTDRERLTKKQNGKWACSCHGWEFDAEDDKYTLVRVGPAVEQLDKPSDYQLADDLHDELLDDAVREGLVANPHAPGSLDWARWAAEKEGVCVQWSPGHGEYGLAWKWINNSFCYFTGGKWIKYTQKDWDIDTSEDGWSIVPDPSLPQTPVETSDETPALKIDPAAITAELDQAIPQWREEGFTVAQAIRVLRQRYEMQMQVCAYQGDSAAANGKYTKRLEEQVATLTTERDAAISEIGKSCAIMAKSHAEEINGIKAERDELLGRCAKAEQERADYLMRFVQADQTASSLQMTCEHFQATIDETLAAAKVVVPEDIQEKARHHRLSGGFVGDVARYVISLIEDSQPAVAPSAEPSVVKELKATPEQLTAATQRAESNMQNAAKWVDPKAQPPSVAQLQASIEAHEKRLVALEGKG